MPKGFDQEEKEALLEVFEDTILEYKDNLKKADKRNIQKISEIMNAIDFYTFLKNGLANTKNVDLDKLFSDYEKVVKNKYKNIDYIELNIDNKLKDEIKVLLEDLKKSTMTGIIEEKTKKQTKPTTHIIPNNKLSKIITQKEIIRGTNVDIEVTDKILTPVNLVFENPKITSKKLTPFQKTVYNAICAFVEVGSHIITDAMIYRHLNGLEDETYIAPKLTQDIRDSIEILMQLKVEIDVTDEMKQFSKKDTRKIKAHKIGGNALDIRYMEVSNNQYSYRAYKILETPIFYEYARITGQIVTIPSLLLNTKSVRNATSESIVIKEALLEKIYTINGLKKQKISTKQKESLKCITLEQILKLADISLEDYKKPRDKKAKVIKMVCSYLDYWIKQKHISSYEKIYQGKSIRAFKIDI